MRGVSQGGIVPFGQNIVKHNANAGFEFISGFLPGFVNLVKDGGKNAQSSCRGRCRHQVFDSINRVEDDALRRPRQVRK